MPLGQKAVEIVRHHLTARESALRSKPLVIPASQDFDGNDGPWSSFTLQIGTPAQDVKVLVSTTGSQTWAIIPQGCTATDPFDCSALRGGEFNPSESSTWTQNNMSSNGTFALGLESNLGYIGNGCVFCDVTLSVLRHFPDNFTIEKQLIIQVSILQTVANVVGFNRDFGYDTVELGWQGSGGPSLDQQVVAGIATEEFYLGVFGLSPRPTNFTNFDSPKPSYLAVLKQRSMIPSFSWSYTAGNQYRLSTVLGSLTLGGYDASRFVKNNVSFAFNSVDERDLTVDVENISVASGNGSRSLLTSTIPAFVDSTIPYIYLPLEVCQQFEDVLGIEWDYDVQAYLVNETLHSKLVTQNATVSLSIGNSSMGQAVEITLPYAAFDLMAEYPLVTNASRYFPLMRASNESQYTLGRTFLQEAYLTADYDRRNFSISQCSWDPNAEQDVITILPPAESSTRHLSSGIMAGVVSGGVAIMLCVGLLGWLCRRLTTSLTDASYRSDEVQSEERIRIRDLHGTHEADGISRLGPEMEGSHAHTIELETRTRRLAMNGDSANRYELAVPESAASEMLVKECTVGTSSRQSLWKP